MKSIEKLLKQDALTAREAAILKLAGTFNQFLTDARSKKAKKGLTEEIAEAIKHKEPSYISVKDAEILSNYSAMYNWLQFQMALMNKYRADYQHGLELLTATLELINTNERFLTKDNVDRLAFTYAKYLTRHNVSEAFYPFELIMLAREKIIDFNAILIALCEVYEIPNLKYLQYKTDSIRDFYLDYKLFTLTKEECAEHIKANWELENISLEKKLKSKKAEVMTAEDAAKSLDYCFDEYLFIIPAPAEEKINLCKDYFRNTPYTKLHKENQEIFLKLEAMTKKLTDKAADLN